MKKIVLALTLAIVIVGVVLGCGKEKEDSSQNSSTPSIQQAKDYSQYTSINGDVSQLKINIPYQFTAKPKDYTETFGDYVYIQKYLQWEDTLNNSDGFTGLIVASVHFNTTEIDKAFKGKAKEDFYNSFDDSFMVGLFNEIEGDQSKNNTKGTQIQIDGAGVKGYTVNFTTEDGNQYSGKLIYIPDQVEMWTVWFLYPANNKEAAQKAEKYLKTVKVVKK